MAIKSFYQLIKSIQIIAGTYKRNFAEISLYKVLSIQGYKATLQNVQTNIIIEYELTTNGEANKIIVPEVNSQVLVIQDSINNIAIVKYGNFNII